MSNVVKTRNLLKEYRIGEVVVPALQGVNLEIEKGQYEKVTSKQR
jgi:ABC-type lipoprotein export system ATPase subunit